MFSEYYKDDVTWSRSGGFDAYGTPVFEDFPLKCRVVEGVRKVIDRTGAVAISTGYILMEQEPGMDDTYFYGGVRHVTLRIEQKKDFRVRGYKVWLA